jgi:adenylate kinase family enzyme
MKRVLVLGCPGAGKSTLSKELAADTGLPLVHLDQIFWRPGWVEPAKEEWRLQIAAALAKPEWILDGNFGSTLLQRLEAADTAILLDLPRMVCLLRVLKRISVSLGRQRPDMAEGCPERFDLKFLLYVWNFGKNHRSKLLEQFEAFAGEKILLRSPAEVRQFLQSMKRDARTSEHLSAQTC